MVNDHPPLKGPVVLARTINRLTTANPYVRYQDVTVPRLVSEISAQGDATLDLLHARKAPYEQVQIVR